MRGKRIQQPAAAVRLVRHAGQIKRRYGAVGVAKGRGQKPLGKFLVGPAFVAPQLADHQGGTAVAQALNAEHQHFFGAGERLCVQAGWQQIGGFERSHDGGQLGVARGAVLRKGGAHGPVLAFHHICKELKGRADAFCPKQAVGMVFRQHGQTLPRVGGKSAVCVAKKIHRAAADSQRTHARGEQPYAAALIRCGKGGHKARHAGADHQYVNNPAHGRLHQD